jgi:molybdopterin-guanine dinucleotide biosynthesis protein A
VSSPEAPVGLILAGGESRRFPDLTAGGKAALPLGDRTLLEHVLHRIEPQVARVWLSVTPATAAAAPAGYPLLQDREPKQRGPLAGLAAGLERLIAEDGNWLVLAPCDTPFLPEDLVERLLAARRPGLEVVVAGNSERLHPTCSVWHRDTRAAVDRALADPRGPGLMALLDTLGHEVVRWGPASPPPFHNINTPADLEAARRWLGDGAC